MNKKPYITDEQISKCILLGILIHKPRDHEREKTPFTITRGNRFLSRTQGSTEGCWFATVDEAIAFVGGKEKKYEVSSFPQDGWGWNQTLEYYYAN